MGLLTNETTRAKLTLALSRYGNKLCLLCYIGGLIYFLLLAYEPLNARVYFSENALLPGLVESDFYSDFGASSFYNDLKTEYTKLKGENERLALRIPSEFLEEKFRSIGLDSYIHNYSFSYPVNILKGQVFHGQNVYGILRAGRTASTEALVLSAPYRPPGGELDKTAVGIALMYGLAKAFRRQTYWAKDIIFLVTEHEHVGMHAWLSAYHQNVKTDELFGRGGSIQAAINLEIGHEDIHRFNLKLEGLSGQLPNLDLVNTIVQLCGREGIRASLQKKVDHYAPESKEGFQHALHVMLRMMLNQASGVPSGNHGLYHRYNIEAVTLQSVRLRGGRHAHGYVNMGRVVEGVFRSLNNLLERFHQSFFFYLLPATTRYISIGLYMPAFGVLAAPIILQALGIWIKINQKKPEASVDSDNTNVETKAQGSFLSLVPTLIMAIVFGLVALNGPSYFIEASHAFRMQPQDALSWGILALMFSAVWFPKIMLRKSKTKEKVMGVNTDYLRLTALLILGTILGACSMLNISLAFFIAAVWIPVVLLIRPVDNRVISFMQYVVLLAICPLMLLYWASLLEQVLNGGAARLDSLELHNKVWDLTTQAILTAVVDYHMLGNWVYIFVCLFVFPNWLLFWALLWSQPSTESCHEHLDNSKGENEQQKQK